MAGEPSEDTIETFIAFTGSDRLTAVRYLKVKNNDVEIAANALFEGEDISGQEVFGASMVELWQGLIYSEIYIMGRIHMERRQRGCGSPRTAEFRLQ